MVLSLWGLSWAGRSLSAASPLAEVVLFYNDGYQQRSLLFHRGAHALRDGPCQVALEQSRWSGGIPRVIRSPHWVTDTWRGHGSSILCKVCESFFFSKCKVCESVLRTVCNNVVWSSSAQNSQKQNFQEVRSDVGILRSFFFF